MKLKVMGHNAEVFSVILGISLNNNMDMYRRLVLSLAAAAFISAIYLNWNSSNPCTATTILYYTMSTYYYHILFLLSCICCIAYLTSRNDQKQRLFNGLFASRLQIVLVGLCGAISVWIFDATWRTVREKCRDARNNDQSHCNSWISSQLMFCKQTTCGSYPSQDRTDWVVQIPLVVMSVFSVLIALSTCISKDKPRVRGNVDTKIKQHIFKVPVGDSPKTINTKPHDLGYNNSNIGQPKKPLDTGENKRNINQPKSHKQRDNRNIVQPNLNDLDDKNKPSEPVPPDLGEDKCTPGQPKPSDSDGDPPAQRSKCTDRSTITQRSGTFIINKPSNKSNSASVEITNVSPRNSKQDPGSQEANGKYYSNRCTRSQTREKVERLQGDKPLGVYCNKCGHLQSEHQPESTKNLLGNSKQLCVYCKKCGHFQSEHQPESTKNLSPRNSNQGPGSQKENSTYHPNSSNRSQTTVKVDRLERDKQLGICCLKCGHPLSEHQPESAENLRLRDSKQGSGSQEETGKYHSDRRTRSQTRERSDSLEQKKQLGIYCKKCGHPQSDHSQYQHKTESLPFNRSSSSTEEAKFSAEVVPVSNAIVPERQAEEKDEIIIKINRKAPETKATEINSGIQNQLQNSEQSQTATFENKGTRKRNAKTNYKRQSKVKKPKIDSFKK